MDKRQVKLKKLEKEREKKVMKVHDKINKLKRKISLIQSKYDKKIERLTGSKK